VYEDEQNLILKLEIPGVEESDLNVSVENNTLTVQGERKFEKEEKEENFHRIERRYGSFTRTFKLPNTVDADKVEASYDKGILKITLAKRAEAKPRQIKVGVVGEKTLQA
jgi:HSP20 family protein